MIANKRLAETRKLQLKTPRVCIDGLNFLIGDVLLFANSTTLIS